MIIVDDVLVADDILTKQFVCDLASCKGGCCVEGDAGAPLEEHELAEVEKAFHEIKNEMYLESRHIVEKNGSHTQDIDYTYVTPIVNDGICVYGTHDENGVVKCLIEKAFNEGRLSFKKPISCHLFPILHTKTESAEFLNYNPRKKLCKPACDLGEELQVPVYKFLEEPLVRKFGKEWYGALRHIGEEMLE